MTDEQRDKIWELADSISHIAQEVDIIANDLSRYRVNCHHIKACRNVVEKLWIISNTLEEVAYIKAESK